jgi:hypothetical protein
MESSFTMSFDPEYRNIDEPKPKDNESVVEKTKSDEKDNTSLNFAPCVVPTKDACAELKSALTEAIISKAPSAVAAGAGIDPGKMIELTVYLPSTEAMEITCGENLTFSDLIRKVLQTHEEEGMRGLRSYTPEYYEIRMHEGDGEPDRDFPALDLKKQLKNFNMNEYCLCENDFDPDDDMMGGGGGGANESGSSGPYVVRQRSHGYAYMLA